VAAVACVAVKEDAFLPLCAVSVALALIRFKSMTRRDCVIYLILPPCMALLNLALYYTYLLPRLRPGGVPVYTSFWGSYGATPGGAVIGMLAAPGRVVTRTLTSGFFTRVLVPHLFLPLIGWRWTLGIIPIVLLYGASDNEQVRSYGIYYAGALLGGITDAGYSLRPWKAEIAAVPSALAQLASEPVVLVQSGLYPHAGYESRVQLLTPEAVTDPRNAGAAVLLAPSVSAWPVPTEQLVSLERLSPIGAMPRGLIAVRVPGR
jgi:hypothetical protein